MNDDDVYYGKYRGKVVANDDPLGLGRLRVSCPAVLGDARLNWALPCTPYAGPQVGWFALPPVGADVWVEFEAGDPDYPIWAGCFWATGQVPVPADRAPDRKLLKTDGVTLTIDERQGATVEVGTQLKITLDRDGIKLTNGGASLKLDTTSVSLNDGALEVM